MIFLSHATLYEAIMIYGYKMAEIPNLQSIMRRSRSNSSLQYITASNSHGTEHDIIQAGSLGSASLTNSPDGHFCCIPPTLLQPETLRRGVF